jgi:hypothetical protein
VSLMRSLLTSVAVLVLSASAAMAASETVAGSYTVSYSATTGNGPSITSPSLNTPTSFNDNLTIGTPVTVTTFSVSPAGSSGDRSNTVTGTITVNFTFNTPNTATTSDTAAYIANYNNDTDSVTWAGSGSNSYAPLVVDFANGSVLDIDLNNASDWTIHPSISFDLVSGPNNTVPEPASIALLGSGLLGLGFVTYRRRKRQAPVRA